MIGRLLLLLTATPKTKSKITGADVDRLVDKYGVAVVAALLMKVN